MVHEKIFNTDFRSWNKKTARRHGLKRKKRPYQSKVAAPRHEDSSEDEVEEESRSACISVYQHDEEEEG